MSDLTSDILTLSADIEKRYASILFYGSILNQLTIEGRLFYSKMQAPSDRESQQFLPSHVPTIPWQSSKAPVTAAYQGTDSQDEALWAWTIKGLS